MTFMQTTKQPEITRQATKQKRFLKYFPIFLCAGFLFFGLTTKASAATLTVNKSGVDSGTCVSSSCLTITYAFTKVNNDDTVMITDATPQIYNETSFLSWPNKTGVTLDSTNGAIIRAASGTIRVLYIGAPTSGTGPTLGNVTIDANNTQQFCISTGSTDIPSLTITGTTLLNPTAAWIFSGHLQNIMMSGNWIAQSNTSGGLTGIELEGATTPGTYTITNGTIISTNAGAGYTRGIYSAPTMAGVNFVIKGITIQQTSANAGATLFGIDLTGVGTADIGDDTISGNITSSNASVKINFLGVVSTTHGIQVHNGTVNSTTSAKIRTVYVSTPLGSGGHGIVIGDDSDTPITNRITGAQMYRNNVYGADHGYLLANITGGKIYDNIGDNLTIGAIAKNTTNSSIYNNILTNIGSGGALRGKLDVNTKFYNNSITIANNGIGIYATNGSTGETFLNNIVYTNQALMQFANFDSTSSGTLTNNDYYTSVTLPTGAWSNGSNYYNTLALWQAVGFDSSSIYSNPLFVSGADFHTQASSPAIDTGTSISGVTSDYAGNPIYGTPDIGSYEYQPPHNLTLSNPDTIDTGAGARIYQDGKFRDLGTTNSTVAHLNITPTGGFTTYGSTDARPAWLDITGITWSNTDVHHKAWTESSTVSGLTNTIHTIGDLELNKYYNVKKDDVLGQNISGTNCTGGICKADANGQITFTYTGTYTTHTFDVAEGDNTGPTGTISNANGSPANNVTPTFNLTIADAGVGITGASMRFSCDNVTWSTWENYATPKTNFNVRTGAGCTDADGSKTVYVEYKDSLGNIGTSYNTGAFTLDTTASFATLSDTPASITNSTSASVAVAGTNITAYEYKLDSGSYGIETVIATPISLSSLTDGSHTLSVIGKNSAGTWQVQGSATTYTWTVDATAPIVTFSIPATSNSLTVPFTTYSATDENGVTGYLVNEISTTPAIDDSGWSGTAQTQYVFSTEGAKTLYAWAKDSVGNISTSGSGSVTITLPIVSHGGGGMIVGWNNLPIMPTGGFKIFVNSGASTTTNRIVNLNFNAGADVKKMAISLTGDFADASQENYSPTKQIDLCLKFGVIKNPTCPNGKYTIYAKFYTAFGVTSPVATSSIILTNEATNISTTKYNFTRNLSLHTTGADVKALQQFLNVSGFIVAKTGAGSLGKETTLFGTLTYKALVKFQKSLGWSGTGFFGPMTRDYIANH